MSKKNILSRERINDSTVHVVFDNEDGKRTYEYKGAAARAIMRGKDPSGISGRMIKFEKKK